MRITVRGLRARPLMLMIAFIGVRIVARNDPWPDWPPAHRDQLATDVCSAATAWSIARPSWAHRRSTDRSRVEVAGRDPPGGQDRTEEPWPTSQPSGKLACPPPGFRVADDARFMSAIGTGIRGDAGAWKAVVQRLGPCRRSASERFRSRCWRRRRRRAAGFSPKRSDPGLHTMSRRRRRSTPCRSPIARTHQVELVPTPVLRLATVPRLRPATGLRVQ